ncbi:class I SAM-dependent methyltransferase, partial [Acidobacteria bacterium AH-259-D05]|nr:class I SAM-dependent methyltransferase [Acidobacteria bacterium AH-259-D05]
MCEKNTSKLWNDFWETSVSEKEDVFSLVKEENSIRWQRIEKIVVEEFDTFQNLNVIEIGAGAGTNAALMAKKGALVTILDYSERALIRAQELFSRNGLTAEFLNEDALSSSQNLSGVYDISMSFGLAEHFRGDEREKINKIHFDVLRKGGIAFISVPHKYNPPYRIFKFLAELLGLWKVGEEFPYSRREFGQICQRIGIMEYTFFGDSLPASFHFINPSRI